MKLTEPQMVAYFRKFIVALIGAATIAVTQGLINGSAAKWTAIIVGFATAVGVRQVPNAKQPEPATDTTTTTPTPTTTPPTTAPPAT